MLEVKIKSKDEKGISLIEASMVLALSAIVISGVMVYYDVNVENEKLQELVTMMQGAYQQLMVFISQIWW